MTVLRQDITLLFQRENKGDVHKIIKFLTTVLIWININNVGHLEVKIIFLDQNKWIELARVEAKKESAAQLQLLYWQ